MPVLSEYVTQVQRLLHDPNAAEYSVSDLTAYINETRSRLALKAECVRVLYGYVDAAKFSLTATAVQGSATLVMGSTSGIVAGQLITASFAPPGTIVFSAPPNTAAGTITMSTVASSSSVGAVATIFTPPFNTVVNQQIYPYPKNVLLSAGVQDVIQVKSVAINMGGPLGSVNATLRQMSWSYFQGYLGYYGRTLQGYPAAWCNYNQAVNMSPYPSSIYPMQWDTCCSVVDLLDDTTPEAVPYPFTDAVKYYASYLALMSSQRAADAANMMKLFTDTTTENRSFIQRTFIPNIYG